MLSYRLLKTQSMLLSATSREGQPDADLQAVQTQSMLLSTMWRRASQMLTYSLFKTKSMLLSATSKERLDASKLTN